MQTFLLVDDDDAFRSTTGELLELLGHKVSLADSVESARLALSHQAFDRVLLDLMLPDGSGLDLLSSITEASDTTQVTLITGHPAIKTLVKSLHGPNVNYLIKPINLAKLQQLINEPTQTVLNQAEDIPIHQGGLVGESVQMKALYETIERVAKTEANVMLFGESGVGKEVVASAIHHASKAPGEFVAVNCGAFARELISSELFGHEKGAFTGAIARKIGVFEQAKHGNLFLDEVTEMPVDLQPNLLRVLETKTLTRLGSTKTERVECRVISATNRSESQLADDACIREDLYFRLAVFPIHIPPLRHRKGDIKLLAKHFINQLNEESGTSFSIDEETLSRLEAYDWPGNVRELRHAIHRAFIMTPPDNESISLPQSLGSPFGQKSAQDTDISPGQTIEEVERRLISATLKELDGDKKRAAEMLGISLKTLYNRLNQYESSHV